MTERRKRKKKSMRSGRRCHERQKMPVWVGFFFREKMVLIVVWW
jgi:hypothetical protein